MQCNCGGEVLDRQATTDDGLVKYQVCRACGRNNYQDRLVALKHENDPMMDESVAYQRGRNAYRAGYQRKDNPYRITGDKQLSGRWQDGWIDQEYLEESAKMMRRL